MEIADTHDTLRVWDSDLHGSCFSNAKLAGMTIEGVLVSDLIRIYQSRPTG
jgi:hypothetical protein